MTRTILLSKLQILQRSLPLDAGKEAFRAAILSENILGKPTESSQVKSLYHLTELYGLITSFLIFSTLRRLASEAPDELPLLAMLCTFCRDPQLHHSFELIDSVAVGEVLPRARKEEHFETGFTESFSKVMKESLAQHVNTIWTACGHLSGRSKRSAPFRRPDGPRPLTRCFSDISSICAGRFC